MKKRFRYAARISCILLALIFLSVQRVYASTENTIENPYHVLYISSYSYSWGTVPLQIAGIDRAFAGIEYVVNYEFMDTKNTEYSEGYKEFYDLLKYKMDTRYPYDGVIVGDDAALNFVEQYQDDLFAGIPVSFLAVDNVENGEKAAKNPLVTGIVEQADYQKNIEVAHHLLPKANRITFILDNMENGIGIAKQLEKQSALFSNYEVDYLNTSKYTRDELCQKLASFDEQDIVFFISMGQQKNDVILTENERYQMIREFASVPMFRLTPAGVGDGAVGGYVVDFEESGYIAGTMIVQMLTQTDAEAPAMRYDTPGMYYFDYNILDKYGLAVSKLPADAVVINQPESVLRTYSSQIIIAMLLILLAAFSIFTMGLKKAQDKVEAKNRELIIANHAKTDFLSHMSHDMRTPMNGILGIASLLKDRTDPEEIREDVEQIERSGKYLLSLINDTLDMNKIESGRMELHPIPVNSEALYGNIIATAQVLAAQKGVKLLLEFPPIPHNGWAAVLTDPSRVEQIFMNLISNAIKFTPQGGTVTLHMDSLSMTEDIVTDRYIISDTGIGMSAEFQEHLFEPFSQEGRANTDHESGTGLGLAIVKQIIEQMGGSIEIESALNQGTKITINLSYPRYHGKLNYVPETQVDISILNGKRVLLCEDHPVNAQIAARLLQKQGVQTERAEDGQIGVDMFQKSSEGYYDAILMDVRMPHKNGLEATQAIRRLTNRKDAQTIPIIAMTANAFDNDVQQCIEAGMNAHLAKPVEPDKLFTELAKQLAKTK